MYFENIDYESLYTIARRTGRSRCKHRTFRFKPFQEKRNSAMPTFISTAGCAGSPIRTARSIFPIANCTSAIRFRQVMSEPGPLSRSTQKNWPANPNVRSNAARLGVGRGRSKFQIQHLALFQQKRPETHPAGLIAPERTGGPMIFVSLPVKSCGHDDKSQTTVPRTRRTDIR